MEKRKKISIPKIAIFFPPLINEYTAGCPLRREASQLPSLCYRAVVGISAYDHVTLKLAPPCAFHNPRRTLDRRRSICFGVS